MHARSLTASPVPTPPSHSQADQISAAGGAAGVKAAEAAATGGAAPKAIADSPSKKR